MKFLITNELKENRLLHLVVLFFTLFLALFLILDVVLQAYQTGLLPSEVVVFLQGDEEAFIEPLLFDILLEKIHTALFFAMVTITMIVIIFIRVKNTTAHRLIHLTFLSAIFAPIMLILGYFYGIVFLYFWLLFYMLWHSIAFYFSFVILWILFNEL